MKNMRRYEDAQDENIRAVFHVAPIFLRTSVSDPTNAG